MAEREEAEYPASDLKLERLRRTGVIPFSAELMTAGAFLGLCAAAGLCWSLAAGRLPLLIEPQSMLNTMSGVREDFLARLGRIGGLILLLMFAATGTVFAVQFLLGVLQNRFLWTTAPLGMDSSRLFKWDFLAGARQRFLKALLTGMLALCSLLVSIMAIRYFLSTGLELSHLSAEAVPADDVSQLRRRLEVSAEALVDAGRGFLVPLGLACLFAGVISRIAGEIAYRREHRMTRSEMEAEIKEMEMSPEFRSARQSRREE